MGVEEELCRGSLLSDCRLFVRLVKELLAVDLVDGCLFFASAFAGANREKQAVLEVGHVFNLTDLQVTDFDAVDGADLVCAEVDQCDDLVVVRAVDLQV